MICEVFMAVQCGIVGLPNVGKSTLVKLLSAAGFKLKGSGWYATDFKNKGVAKPSESAKKEETKSEQPASSIGACPASN